MAPSNRNAPASLGREVLYEEAKAPERVSEPARESRPTDLGGLSETQRKNIIEQWRGDESAPLTPERLLASVNPDHLRRADFFTLMEVLQKKLGGARLGTHASPADEKIRLRHNQDLTFAAGDVAKVEPDHFTDDGVAVTTNFLGVSGTQGTLPLFLAEEIVQENDDNPVRRDLLDLFHHRALSMLHRVVMRTRPGSILEADGSDAWTERLLGAGGAHPGHLSVADKLRILPLLSTSRRSAFGLETALRVLLRERLDEDELHVELLELAGKRSRVADHALTRLGKSNHALGQSTVLGARVMDPTSRVVVVIAPVREQHYPRFLAGQDIHLLIGDVLAMFDPTYTEMELELHVEAHDRGVRLGAREPLGRSTWLASNRPSRKVQIQLQVRSPVEQAAE